MKKTTDDIRLTPKQKMMLEFINSFRAEKGFAPSQHEIAKHFGFKSLGTVQNYLVRLERQGAIQKTWNARRGMNVAPNAREQILEPSHDGDFRRLPLVGFVAAGRPIEAIESQDWIDVPPSMVAGRGSFFILKVKGDSMIEDGILDGDFVIIRKQESAVNGQTVVALIDNSATIKRFYKRADGVELHPANPSYKPIVVNSDERKNFKIEGVLAGVMRRF